jgi:hypothetical protein
MPLLFFLLYQNFLHNLQNNTSGCFPWANISAIVGTIKFSDISYFLFSWLANRLFDKWLNKYPPKLYKINFRFSNSICPADCIAMVLHYFQYWSSSHLTALVRTLFHN